MYHTENELITVVIGVEIVLRNREDTRRIQMALKVPTSISNMEELMTFATHFLLNDLDTVGQTRMVLEDENCCNHIYIISDIQTISLYAPAEFPEELGQEPPL